MQSAPRAPGSNQPPVKIYNAVYSSVQVYECMVRGIAVMRRRGDSYVNATQILKVAGVDKGRRTKILEKEILPGKHEIVQGGYGKYQGTWIPLERGRDIALQYGVAPLLSPLFDFTPSTNSLGALPASTPAGTASPRPLSASSSYSSLGAPGNFLPAIPSHLAPPPIMPGSALRLLNQGRAQGLFTPSTSSAAPARAGHSTPQGYGQSPFAPSSQTPPPGQSLKRNRSEADADSSSFATQYSSFQSSSQPNLEASADIFMNDTSRPPSAGSHINGEDGPSPTKRIRKDISPQHPQSAQHVSWQLPPRNQAQASSGPRDTRSTPQPGPSALPRPASAVPSNGAPGKPPSESPDIDNHTCRFSSKPSVLRVADRTAPLRDTRRAAIVTSICQRDDPAPVLDLLREITPNNPNTNSPGPFDVDAVIDDQGHTALHLAASLGRQQVAEALLTNGADMHRGNYLGETPLMRACLATHNADQQSFHTLVASLNPSIRTLDTAKTGVKGRAVPARYYLDQIFYWVAQHQGGDFKSLVDLQDEHGDTALNIAARVGNRSLVRTLLDVGANRILPNKLGLRPGDFGVETEELSGGPRAEDILAALRSGPPAPVQKSQDVIADMTAMIQNLSTEFQSEVKSKQDALDVTQAHLRAATRELSEQRKQIQAWQARCGELDQITQRVRNIEKATLDEDQFDWTGRTDLDGNDALASAGPAFQQRGPTRLCVDAEPPIPTTDSVASLIRLRRLKMWHMRMEELMKARLKSLQGASAEKEYQCKKIVALCTGIPIDKVEEMLENLVIAVESEAQIVDIGRVSGFMQKVRDGII
ncbi:apses-domain-containing protein [Infundibulicybe gibba]|nr:apses-domain-containing protein [Infundibulicybe gibba]